MTDLFENKPMRISIQAWEAIVSQVKTLTVVIEEGAGDGEPAAVQARLPIDVAEVPHAQHVYSGDLGTVISRADAEKLPPIIPFQHLDAVSPPRRATGSTGDSTKAQVPMPPNDSDLPSKMSTSSEVAQKRNRDATAITSAQGIVASPSTSNRAAQASTSRSAEKAPAYTARSAPLATILLRSPSEDEEVRPTKRLRVRSSKVRPFLSVKLVLISCALLHT